MRLLSILMIISGIIWAFVSIVGTIGIGTFGALGAAAGGEAGAIVAGALFMSSVVRIALALLYSIFEVIGGCRGLSAASDPRKAAGCITIGAICVIITVASYGARYVFTGELHFWELAASLIVPSIYILLADRIDKRFKRGR